MYTIATAGHIDHGKSSLVKALTGTDPDRLPEEKEREMTIELGFASFQLSGGEEVGIIDVPGHERFIKNMISGVGALDLVLFVVASDDGWMPQSEEHLAILRYLGLERGIIILTKVDMVDPDWAAMVKGDLNVKTKGTFLEGAEIIEFSAIDNRNLDTIKQAIEKMLKLLTRRTPGDSARLYVDRVFTIAGTGTVVTGTLREGTLAVGQEILHHPSGQKTKVKNLESFYSHLDSAQPGVRLAVGLQSLERGAVKRGDLLYTSSQLQTSDLLGIKLQVEPRHGNFIKHNREIVFLHGTSEVEGRLLLPAEPLASEDGALIGVLRLESPVIAKAADRFILRLPTPSILIGGGQVIDPLLQTFKRSDTAPWNRLASVSPLTPESLIRYELTVKNAVEESQLLAQSRITRTEINRSVSAMSESGLILRRGQTLILKSTWDDAGAAVLAAVKDFHRDNQHLTSMPLATLSAAVKLPESLFMHLLEGLLSSGKLERHEAGVKIREYSAGLSAAQEQGRLRILKVLQDNPRQSISRDEIIALDKDGRKIYAFLKQTGQIVDLGGMVYLKEIFDRLAADIVAHLKTHGKMTVAEARDITQTSRKVILPLLEELDRLRITKRDGDYRSLWT